LEILSEFDTFWHLYPRRTGKGAARRRFEQALKRTTALSIMNALQAQLRAGMFSRDPQFVPHPATWLYQDRWEDEVVSSRPAFRNGALEALARSMEQPTLLEHSGDD
jgi:hypothetical protein